MDSQKLRMVDLFAGTGGFSLGFHETQQVETVYANDCEQASKLIYDINIGVQLECTDINKVNLNLTNIDILTAGFPCQPFSIAGEQLGFADPRSNVFWKVIQILTHIQPRVIILENVKNLQSHDQGRTYTTIIDQLHAIGYQTKSKILNTWKVTGIPHNRERIYIIASKNETLLNTFQFPSDADNKRPISEFLEHNDTIATKYYINPQTKAYQPILQGVTAHISNNTVYQYRRYYVRENKNGLCPTLTANMGTGGHNVPFIKTDKGIRKLTPRECFNLQGFPSTYTLPDTLNDSALYKLAGNAISVPVVYQIAQRLVELLT